MVVLWHAYVVVNRVSYSIQEVHIHARNALVWNYMVAPAGWPDTEQSAGDWKDVASPDEGVQSDDGHDSDHEWIKPRLSNHGRLRLKRTVYMLAITIIHNETGGNLLSYPVIYATIGSKLILLLWVSYCILFTHTWFVIQSLFQHWTHAWFRSRNVS